MVLCYVFSFNKKILEHSVLRICIWHICNQMNPWRLHASHTSILEKWNLAELTHRALTRDSHSPKSITSSSRIHSAFFHDSFHDSGADPISHPISFFIFQILFCKQCHLQFHIFYYTRRRKSYIQPNVFYKKFILVEIHFHYIVCLS